MRRKINPDLPDHLAIEAVEAIERAVADGAVWPVKPGGLERSALAEVAAALGISSNTLRNRIRIAGDRLGRWPNGINPGWAPPPWVRDRDAYREARRQARKGKKGFDPVLPGYEIAETTVSFDGGGKVLRRTVRQKPEAGEEFAIPEGRRLGKITAQVGPDGRVEREWVRHNTGEDPGAAIKAALEAFGAYRGHAKLPPAPQHCDSDLLTVYPLPDLHLGMYAWAEEAGEDYDLDIAARVFRETFGALVRRAPESKTAILLGLGDLFHADNLENRTRRSGHALDVDTRYPKVLTAGMILLRGAVEMLLAKHERVIIRILPGNHDEHSAHAVAAGFAMFFEGHARVEVDQDPSLFWFFRFGQNMLAAHHGHEAKPKDAAGIMASHRPQDWGETEWRHMLFGHLHHSQTGGEGAGVVWEIFQTIAPKDAWGAGKAFWAARSLSALTYHYSTGPYGRASINIPATKRRARRAGPDA